MTTSIDWTAASKRKSIGNVACSISIEDHHWQILDWSLKSYSHPSIHQLDSNRSSVSKSIHSEASVYSSAWIYMIGPNAEPDSFTSPLRISMKQFLIRQISRMHGWMARSRHECVYWSLSSLKVSFLCWMPTTVLWETHWDMGWNEQNMSTKIARVHLLFYSSSAVWRSTRTACLCELHSRQHLIDAKLMLIQVSVDFVWHPWNRSLWCMSVLMLWWTLFSFRSRCWLFLS